jgi:glycosyltransferase involved in cell wall biosynthesis
VKKLVIISHTDHQRTAAGEIVGWGPTVTEINYLAGFWDEVVHVACFEDGPPKGSSLPYDKINIRLESIPPFGGKRLQDKISIITNAPQIISTVTQALKGATHVQLRLPMGIGIFLLPYFTFRDRNKYIFWVKYANNWKQKKPPAGYAFQRWFLDRNLADCKTTINGFWDDQPAHCVSFENPSLRMSDLDAGKFALASKTFIPPYTFAFIGRMEDEKGVTRILDAIRCMNPETIGMVHFIGDGKRNEEYIANASFLGDKVRFHGYQRGDVIRAVLSASHFFLLPTTASEGFPKVVAEACCYGCIPIVSDTSSIPHYVKNGQNGFVWNAGGSMAFVDVLTDVVTENKDRLNIIANNGRTLAEKFTLERYYNRLNSEIFNV